MRWLASTHTTSECHQPHLKLIHSCFLLTKVFSRYNGKWSRAVQNAIGTVLYCGWLGGLPSSQPGEQSAELGRLLTLEEVGAVFKGMFTSFTCAIFFHCRFSNVIMIFSSNQPQNPRRFPPHHRGVPSLPPRSDQRPCPPGHKRCHSRRLRPAPRHQRLRQGPIRWFPATEP